MCRPKDQAITATGIPVKEQLSCLPKGWQWWHSRLAQDPVRIKRELWAKGGQVRDERLWYQSEWTPALYQVMTILAARLGNSISIANIKNPEKPRQAEIRVSKPMQLMKLETMAKKWIMYSNLDPTNETQNQKQLKSLSTCLLRNLEIIQTSGQFRSMSEMETKPQLRVK